MQRVPLLEIPEVAPDAVADLLMEAEARRFPPKIGNAAISSELGFAPNDGFEPFVVRGVGVDFAKEHILGLPSTNSLDLFTQERRTNTAEVRSMHTDNITSNQGFITAHATTLGKVRFVVADALSDKQLMQNSRELESLITGNEDGIEVRMRARRQATRQLAQRGLWGFNEPLPNCARVTDAGPSDVVFFDHTQPHGVIALGTGRTSVPIYPKAPHSLKDPFPDD